MITGLSIKYLTAAALLMAVYAALRDVWYGYTEATATNLQGLPGAF